MFELRPLKPDDIIEIRNNLVVGENKGITDEVARKAIIIGRAFTFLKNNEVVACVGEVNIEKDITDIWALYSNKFSCFTRMRAMLEFRKLLKNVDGKVRIQIPEDFKNSYRYARFLGFLPIGEKNKLQDIEYMNYVWGG